MKKWIILIVSLFILLSLLSFVLFYQQSRKSVVKAEEKVTQLAIEQHKLVTVKKTYIYHGKSTSYVATGENDSKDKLAVFYTDKWQFIKSVDFSNGISEKSAVDKLKKEENPDKILSVSLGIENNEPIWEMAYLDHDQHLNYYYVEFESGDWLRKISNL
jgi:uncharacterized protein YpmB